MGYQALLFCPDEKTARTVTQVLSELDFEVVPCTEPFAAVKKLMGEHFDAVVVDCDNEQNATLLFKSARNSPNNQSALAVAVVEGQAGVAKAFRIGANLVLTKPINVEQAKGTLRVARGLLRKNEGAKQTGATTATPKPPTPTPPPAKPTLVPSIATTRPSSTVSPLPPPSVPVQKPAPQSSFAASASSPASESGESNESVQALHTQTTPPNVVSIISEHKPEIIPSKPETPVGTGMKTGPSMAASSGAASAPAPAREESSGSGAQHKSSTVIPATATSIAKSAPIAESSTAEAATVAAPSLTFGGAVESSTESSSGGSKKIMVGVAAAIVIAAGGYAAWTQFGQPNKSTAPAVKVAARPVAPTAAQATSGTTATEPVLSTSSAVSETSVPSASPKSIKSAKTADNAKPTAAPNTGKDHQSKASSEAYKPAVDDAVAENKTPATPEPAQPLVVKKGSGEATLGKSSATDAPMPSITGIAAAGNGGTLPNLLGNQNNSPAPVLQTLSVSQGVSQGLAIKKTPPSYPANALRLRIEGPVQLMATISKKGDISAVKIISGDPSLARAAADAVKQWKYKPYLLDGSPVEIQTQITVNFKLPR
jgi:TonB family protein